VAGLGMGAVDLLMNVLGNGLGSNAIKT